MHLVFVVCCDGEDVHHDTIGGRWFGGAKPYGGVQMVRGEKSF